MSFRRLGAGLPGVVSSWFEDPELRWRIVEKAWTLAVGPDVARHAKALSLDDGVLRARVDDDRWRTTLPGLERQILRALREALGADVVRRIEWL